MMEVETKHARLDTLSVTIQALHVSGKQMTLAVFRQLKKGHEDENSELWGVVKYPIKDEGENWLVFSTDGTLRRRALGLIRPRKPRDIEKLEKEIEYLLTEQKRIKENPMYISLEYRQSVDKKLVTSSNEIDELRFYYEGDLNDYERDCSHYKDLPHLFIAV